MDEAIGVNVGNWAMDGRISDLVDLGDGFDLDYTWRKFCYCVDFWVA